MSLDYLIKLLEKARITSSRVIFTDEEPRVEIKYRGEFVSSYSTTSYHGRHVFGFEDYYEIKKAKLEEKARRNFKRIEKRVQEKLKKLESVQSPQNPNFRNITAA